MLLPGPTRLCDKVLDRVDESFPYRTSNGEWEVTEHWIKGARRSTRSSRRLEASAQIAVSPACPRNAPLELSAIRHFV